MRLLTCRGKRPHLRNECRHCKSVDIYTLYTQFKVQLNKRPSTTDLLY